MTYYTWATEERYKLLILTNALVKFTYILNRLGFSLRTKYTHSLKQHAVNLYVQYKL